METGQRILFSGLLAVVAPGSVLQLILAIICALVFIRIYSIYTPYVNNTIGTLKNMVQWQIFLVLFLILLLKLDALSKYKGILVACLIFFVFMGLIYDIFITLIIPKVKELNNKKGTEINSSIVTETTTENIMRDKMELNNVAKKDNNKLRTSIIEMRNPVVVQQI